MLFRCTQICMLTALLSTSVAAKPAEIYGNAYGLWSPTHPHVTSGKDKPNSPVLYEPDPVPIWKEPLWEQPDSETIAEADVCPTLQSAPHLCPPV